LIIPDAGIAIPDLDMLILIIRIAIPDFGIAILDQGIMILNLGIGVQCTAQGHSVARMKIKTSEFGENSEVW